jgi:hypothetical protein
MSERKQDTNRSCLILSLVILGVMTLVVLSVVCSILGYLLWLYINLGSA